MPMTPENLSLIWAQDSSGVIGINGQIPWDVPEDLAYFHQVTRGSYVVMGTKTFLSLPHGALSQRINIVIGKTFAERMWEICVSRGPDSREIIYQEPGTNIQDMFGNNSFIYAGEEFPINIVDDHRCISAALFFPDINTWMNYQSQIFQSGCSVFIIGGENIYAAFMPFAQRLYITQIVFDSRSSILSTEIHDIAYAPPIPLDFRGKWNNWECSVQGLDYRFGTFDRELPYTSIGDLYG